MIRDYLATYDFNLPLDDAAVDPDLPLVRRRLASLATAEGLNAGYYEAQELAEAFLVPRVRRMRRSATTTAPRVFACARFSIVTSNISASCSRKSARCRLPMRRHICAGLPT